MRLAAAMLLLSLSAMGCKLQSDPVFHETLKKPRVSRVNFRPDGKTIRSTNYLLTPNIIKVGSSAKITLYSETELRVELNQMEYLMVPTEGQKFPTQGPAVDTFLAKYFADGTEPINIYALGPTDYQQDVIEGRRRRGMTKEQVYASLGPPWKINGETSAMTLSREEILASDHWVYPLKWLLVAPDLTDLYFGDGLLQKL